nr:PilC/PilY family type IV pilus protein [uncultured Halomonas sp.]
MYSNRKNEKELQSASRIISIFSLVLLLFLVPISTKFDLIDMTIASAIADDDDISSDRGGVPYQTPRSAQANVDPRSMIVMSNDHQLFFKAYTDWSDIDGDGIIDDTYKSSINYYGYFDSQSCYDYDDSIEGGAFKRANASGEDYTCSGNKYWSGNFLNWVSMTRIDILRKVLYGGKRFRDNKDKTTLLERAYLPYDAHSFVRVVSDNNTLNKNTPFNGQNSVSFCSTTGYTGTRESKDVDDPPLLRTAIGEWPNWAANERWQCVWRDESRRKQGEQAKRPFTNEGKEYRVRVEVCTETTADTDECARYADSSHSKPIGLLHEYANDVDFGLLSGSYEKNLSGGVLRANTRKFREEFDTGSGIFKSDIKGIVSNIDAFRISRYSYSDGTYNNKDNCRWGKRLSDLDDGECSNWGNPLAEMTEEALRYLAGEEEANEEYDVRKNENDEVEGSFVKGLTSPAWENNTGEAWCAAQSMILINASEASFDSNDLDDDIESWTNKVAKSEGINGKYLVGETDDNENRLCTAKTINSDEFHETLGICPGAPGLKGSYNVAGLTRYAFENPIVKSEEDPIKGSNVSTYAVRLSANTPVVDLGSVKIVPACENTGNDGRCAIVDFRPKSIGENKGVFEITWEDSEFGGDYDSDLEMQFEYELEGEELTITTNVISQSSNAKLGVGYILSGTDARFEDPEEGSKTTSNYSSGFIAHSGISNYSGSLCNGCVQGDGPSIQRYRVSPGGSASTLKPPLYYAAKYGNTSKDDSPAAYFEVNRVDKLVDALRSVFDAVQNSGKRSGAGLGYSASVDGRVFQTQYDNQDGWSGNLVAYETNAAGIGLQLWNAKEQLKSTSRIMITTDPASGAGIPLTDNRSGLSEEIVTHLRNAPLGDMIGSRPFVVGKPNSYYVPSGPDDTSYIEFQASQQGRIPMVYAGANDGMLHGFSARIGEDGGKEKLAYIPGILLDSIPELAESDYEHRYYVDGNPTVLDARINGNWRSVLISGLGAGGRGVFALDVTNPGSFSEANADEIALFEYGSSIEQALFGKEMAQQHLGHIYGNPSLIQLENKQGDTGDRFAAVFGNGYFSPSGKAALYIVELNGAADGKIAAGDVTRLVVPDESKKNGLSTASLVDLDGNGRVDTAYAGDLQGNLWRFDLTQNTSELLFSAERNDIRQAITTAIEVGRHPDGGPMLFFGTGSRPELGVGEIESRGKLGTFYAIRDNKTRSLERNDLSKRTLLTQPNIEAGVELRYFDKDSSSSNTNGWYMDFPDSERVVSNPLLYGDHIVITTLIPGQGVCGAEDGGFFYELSAFDGNALTNPVLDINKDDSLDDQDKVNGKTPVGIRTEGAVFGPVIDTHLDENSENKLTVNTKAELQTFKGTPLNPFSLGRVAWRELEN